MVLRLTRTGKIFLGVIVMMHLASITSQSGLLIWLVGLIVGCIAVNVVAAIGSARHVTLRTPLRMLVEEGSAPREAWELKNNGKGTARLITVESNERVWLKAAEIPARKTVAVAPRNVFKVRGVYSLADAWLVSLFPFGLAKAMRDAEALGEVLVYPKLEKVATPQVRGLDPMFGGQHTGIGRSAAGSKFAGVRPIQNGDSFKQIHWKSSSKGGGLMVKTYEEELAGRAALLVFCDKRDARAEDHLRMAGSLAMAGLEAGHQIDWNNLNEGRRVLLPPFSDASTLLEELARYKITKGDLKAEALQNALDMIRPRVAIHFVVTSMTPSIQEAVNELRSRERLVVVHLPDGELENVESVAQPFAEV
jgi:uncharacterized protein (DUF58 family)